MKKENGKAKKKSAQPDVAKNPHDDEPKYLSQTTHYIPPSEVAKLWNDYFEFSQGTAYLLEKDILNSLHYDIRSLPMESIRGALKEFNKMEKKDIVKISLFLKPFDIEKIFSDKTYSNMAIRANGILLQRCKQLAKKLPAFVKRMENLQREHNLIHLPKAIDELKEFIVLNKKRLKADEKWRDFIHIDKA